MHALRNFYFFRKFKVICYVPYSPLLDLHLPLLFTVFSSYIRFHLCVQFCSFFVYYSIRVIFCVFHVLISCIVRSSLWLLYCNKRVCVCVLLKSLTPSTPAVPNCCYSKGSTPYCSNSLFLIFDILALWRSGLSKMSECRKLKMVG